MKIITTNFNTFSVCERKFRQNVYFIFMDIKNNERLWLGAEGRDQGHEGRGTLLKYRGERSVNDKWKTG